MHKITEVDDDELLPPRPDTGFGFRPGAPHLSPIILPSRPKTSTGFITASSNLFFEEDDDLNSSKNPDDNSRRRGERSRVLPTPKESPWTVSLDLSNRVASNPLSRDRPRSANLSTLSRRENEKFARRYALAISSVPTRVKSEEEIERYETAQKMLAMSPPLRPAAVVAAEFEGVLEAIEEGLTGKHKVKKELVQQVAAKKTKLKQKIRAVIAVSRAAEQGERMRIRDYHGKGTGPLHNKIVNKVDMYRNNPDIFAAFSKRCEYLQKQEEEKQSSPRRKHQSPTGSPASIVVQNRELARCWSPEERQRSIERMKVENEKKMEQAKVKLQENEEEFRKKLVMRSERHQQLVEMRLSEHRRKVYMLMIQFAKAACSMMTIVADERQYKTERKKRQVLLFVNDAFLTAAQKAGRGPSMDRATAMECLGRRFLPHLRWWKRSRNAVTVIRKYLQEIRDTRVNTNVITKRGRKNIKFLPVLCTYPLIKTLVLQNFREQWELMDSLRLAKCYDLLLSSLPLSYQSLLRRNLSRQPTRKWREVITAVLLQLANSTATENKKLGSQLLDISDETSEAVKDAIRKKIAFLPAAEKMLDSLKDNGHVELDMPFLLPKKNYFSNGAARLVDCQEILYYVINQSEEISILTKGLLPYGVNPCILNANPTMHRRNPEQEDEGVDPNDFPLLPRDKLEVAGVIRDLVCDLADIDDWRFRYISGELRDWLLEQAYMEMRRNFVRKRRPRIQKKMLDRSFSILSKFVVHHDRDHDDPILFPLTMSWQQISDLISLSLIITRKKMHSE